MAFSTPYLNTTLRPKKQIMRFSTAKLLITLLSILHASFATQAQSSIFGERLPYMAQYYFNQLLYNPAYAGESSQPSIGISGRMGEERGNSNFLVKPRTAQLFMQGEIKELAQLEQLNMGLGMVAQYHKYDDRFQRGTEVFSSNNRLLKIGVVNSYRTSIQDIIDVRIGFQVGLLHYQSDELPNTGSINPPVTQILNERFFKPVIDIGFLFMLDNLRVGMAINSANEPEFDFFSTGFARKFRREGYFTASYEWVITPYWYLQPSMMFQTLLNNQNAFSRIRPRSLADFSVQVNYFDTVFMGLSYRVGDAPFRGSIMVGGRLADTYQLSLAYQFKKRNTSNHSRIEATLGFYLQRGNIEVSEEELEEF